MLNRPKGYWIGLEVPFEDERWGIDCWFQQPAWSAEDPADYSRPLAALSQTAKDLILQTKYDLIYKGLYGRVVYSTDIYDAVLNNRVDSLEDVLRVLKV